MPIGITSPAKNLFLIGSTGASSTQDFLRRITPDGADSNQITPNSVLYDDPSQKMFVAGSQRDATYSIYEGFIYRTGDEDGTPIDYNVKLQAADRFSNVFFEALCYDSDLNLYACGNWDDGATPTTNRNYAPCLSKFNSSGEHQWTITPRSATGDLDQIVFKDVCADTYGNVYVTGFGITDEKLHIAKYDTHGTIIWHKSYTDVGSNSFYGFGGQSIDINSKDELIIVGTAFGPAKYMSVMVKVSTDGEFLWDKSIEIGDDPANNFFQLTDVHVDGNDQIYLCGHDDAFLTGTYESYVIKMTKEGNMLWQTKTNEPTKDIYFQEISVDTLTGQSIVAGLVQETNNAYQIIQRYSNAGNLIWTRKIQSPNNEATLPTMSSDPSYYYIAFADQTGGAADPTSFILGKLSVTGSGLGDFQYDDGAALQDYEIVSINTEVATLRDGSLRNDTSDFITYPFSPIKVVFGENAGGNLIYSDKKLQYETNDHQIEYVSEAAAASPVPVTASDVVRDANLLLNYEFDNDYNFDRSENVVGSSEDFTVTGSGRWASAGNVPDANVTPNYGLSPFGEMNATRMINTDATPKFRRWQPNVTANGNVDTSGQWNCSVYAKALSNPCTLRINSYDGVSDKGSFFDLVNGAVTSSYGSPDATSVEAVGNGWYRISQTTTNAAAGGDHQLHLDPGADLLLFGAQMERGVTSPTRYVVTGFGTYLPQPTTVNNLPNNLYTATMGVIGNAPTFNPDGYFEFDHTNSEIIVLDGTVTDPFPKPTTPSIEAWAYKSNWNDGIENRIFSCTQGGGYNFGVGEGLMGSANIGSIMYANGAYAVASVARSTVSSGWHHFFASWDGSILRFYIDGTEVATDNSRSGNITYPTTTDFLIGGEPGAAGSPDSGKYLNGRVGEIRVYDRTITATEVSQNFNATRGKYGV